MAPVILKLLSGLLFVRKKIEKKSRKRDMTIVVLSLFTFGFPSTRIAYALNVVECARNILGICME